MERAEDMRMEIIWDFAFAPEDGFSFSYIYIFTWFRRRQEPAGHESLFFSWYHWYPGSFF